MLNTWLRKQIEWHFIQYNADIELRKECELEIIESNLCANLKNAGRSNKISDPTFNKVSRLIDAELDKIFSNNSQNDWAAVVRETFTAFRRLKPHKFKIMTRYYIERKNIDDLIKEGLINSARVFWRFRDEWLWCALEMVEEIKERYEINLL